MRAEHAALISGPLDDRLLFTANGRTPISDMTMLKAIHDMKLEVITVHGFRSTFADWAAERTSVAKEVTEKALAHRIPNAVEAAYRRTDFFDKRWALMADWGEHVSSAPSSNKGDGT